MADFCKQCSLDMFGEDFGELAGLTSAEDWLQSKAVTAICEGCGVIQVDPEGNCASKNCLRQSKPGHGVQWHPRPPKPEDEEAAPCSPQP